MWKVRQAENVMHYIKLLYNKLSKWGPRHVAGASAPIEEERVIEEIIKIKNMYLLIYVLIIMPG